MKNRAIAPEQKKEVLDSILKVWLNNPELRLGQLLEIAYDLKENTPDPFYLEDFELVEVVKSLDDYLKRMKKDYDKSKPTTNNTNSIEPS